MSSAVTSLVAVVLVLVAAAAAAPDPGYRWQSRPYHYEYRVDARPYGANLGQRQIGDGQSVRGSYAVDLPDGRKQRVFYTADDRDGYVANVIYEGTAHHPMHYRTHRQDQNDSQRNYNPARMTPPYHQG